MQIDHLVASVNIALVTVHVTLIATCINLKLSLLTTTNIKNILCDIVDVAYNNFLSLII